MPLPTYIICAFARTIDIMCLSQDAVCLGEKHNVFVTLKNFVKLSEISFGKVLRTSV